MNLKSFSIFLVLLAYSTISFCGKLDSLPEVFMIGDHELEYESLVVECSDILLNVCDDSMEEAYEHWLLMLHDIEKYAIEQDIEIRGVKLWLNVFWNTDGTIKHLVFYPKPNCRNMDFEELSDFFTDFTIDYNFTKENSNCFAHYGSASFPTHTELLFKKE
jgi:hypothetical protein